MDATVIQLIPQLAAPVPYTARQGMHHLDGPRFCCGFGGLAREFPPAVGARDAA